MQLDYHKQVETKASIMNASIINICNDDLQEDVEYMYILYSKKWTGVVVIQATAGWRLCLSTSQ